jgi:hypothetical protein
MIMGRTASQRPGAHGIGEIACSLMNSFAPMQTNGHSYRCRNWTRLVPRAW